MIRTCYQISHCCRGVWTLGALLTAYHGYIAVSLSPKRRPVPAYRHVMRLLLPFGARASAEACLASVTGGGTAGTGAGAELCKGQSLGSLEGLTSVTEVRIIS